MSFTKVRQSAGSWSLALREDLPYSISQELSLTDAGFAHLVVTPTRLPADQIDWTALRGLSIYTGVLRKRSNRTNLSGAHATIWLGDEDKKGNIDNVVSSAGQTFQWWVDALRKESTGAGLPQIDLGSVESLGGSYAGSWNWQHPQQVSRRDQLLELCSWASAEFRVTDALALDAGSASYLYGATPTVVLTSALEGIDSTWESIRCTFTPTEDVEDWTSDVVYPDASGGHLRAGAHTYLNGIGTSARWIRKLDLDASQTYAINDATAAQQLGRFQEIRQTLEVRTDAYAVMMRVEPGERVYAWDPAADVYDLATTPIYYRGRLINPQTLVVNQVTMPASPGMGMYLRRGDGEIFDLSDWYVPETGDASLQVGDRPQSIRAALRSRGFADVL